MKTSKLRLALILSLLVNVGVLGAIGYRVIAGGGAPAAPGEFAGLARHLSLSEAQQRHWHEAESTFLTGLAQGSAEIHRRRERLIGEIFADAPDVAKIEAERAAIARVQDDQQRLVIEQLLRERELLDARQRDLLARLLLSQPVGTSSFEQLHRE